MSAKLFLNSGGLAKVNSYPGGSRMKQALSWIGPSSDPPSPLSEAIHPTEYFIFISDEGFLYPPALQGNRPIPLSRLVLVKVKIAEDVWKVGLETIQTGIFSWIFLRPSRGCSSIHLRKMQLECEKTKSRVVVLSQSNLPHWMFKFSLDAFPPASFSEDFADEKNLVFSPSSHSTPSSPSAINQLRAKLKAEFETKLKGKLDPCLRRSLSGTHSQGDSL